ncbi:hypothetical protein AB3X55_05485 [Alphaproteobacteria bacterium LSUCC0719]
MNNQIPGFVAADATGLQDLDLARSAGAANLIDNCIGNVEGMTVLLVCEDPRHGWYDNAAPDRVHRELAARGATVRRMTVDLPENHPNAEVQAAMNDVDRVVFFSRLGDQGRFNWHYTGPRCVMSYALNETMLEGGFGSLDHQSMCQIKAAVDMVTLSASHIRVTCPLGTNFEGSPSATVKTGSEVVIERFPMGIPQPVLAAGFQGRAVLSHYLTPTGSKVYAPAYLPLREPVVAHFEANRIIGFSGAADIVAEVEAHYDRVAGEFDLDGYNVDSWHAGIHPLMAYDQPAAADPLRWSGSAFQHPRLLHFHTCGSGPPGEISWMILDPTIEIDGIALWENGRLYPERFEAMRQILDRDPALAAAFQMPAGAVGVEPVSALADTALTGPPPAGSALAS